MNSAGLLSGEDKRSDQQGQLMSSDNNHTSCNQKGLEQPMLLGLVFTITSCGYFHAIAFNLVTQLMIYAGSIKQIYLFCLGTLFGLILGFGLSQNMSKRYILMIADLLFAFGIAASFITYSYYMISAVLLGFSVSLSLFALLLELKELVPKSSYLAQHMSIYSIYFSIGLMVSELSQINLNDVYNKASTSFDVDSFSSGQVVFLSVSLGLVLLRCILLGTVFRIQTPFEIIRFHQPKSKFVRSFAQLYSTIEDKALMLQVVKKYNSAYIQPENISNHRFWRDVLEGTFLNFFVMASGCQIFINTQQISVNNDNLQDLSTWMLLILGLCGLVGSVISYFVINRYTRIRWAQIGLISTMVCQGTLAAMTKYELNTFAVFCAFHFLISLCFLPAIYSFCAQKFLERGLVLCHFGLWLGFFIAVIVFYYGFLQQDQFNPVSFIVFSAVSFVGLVFISFYAEEPAHCLYLDANTSKNLTSQLDPTDNGDENENEKYLKPNRPEE